MDDRPTVAARNNAQWCDLVCRSHGLATRFDDDAWTCSSRTPVYYPDAVTLGGTPSVEDLLARVDGAPGCSIKDSFGSLDLTGHGFRVLFDAQWIARAPSSPPRPTDGARWERVSGRDTFATWEKAWRGDDGPSNVLRPALVDHDEVAVLALRAGAEIVAGAIVNAGMGVAGISNFFGDTDASENHWAACVACAQELFPDSALVGYESGTRLAAARAVGLEIVGPLRVSIRSPQGD